MSSTLSSVIKRAVTWGRQNLELILVWMVPTVCIPTLRFMTDPPDLRTRLLIRDAGSYTLGSGIFILSKLAAERVTKSRFTQTSQRSVFGTCVGLVANVLFAGIAAPKLSQALTPRRIDLTEKPTVTLMPLQPLAPSFAYGNSPNRPIAFSASRIFP